MSRKPTNPLWKRYEAEEKIQNRLHEQTEAKVVRWEYWSDFHWHWDPSVTQTQQLENGAGWRKDPPKQTNKKDAYYQYGLDAEDRIVIIRYGFPNEAPLREDLIRYSGSNFAVSQFASGELDSVASGTMINGQTVHAEQVGRPEKDWMKVTWEENQPLRIVFGEYGGKADLEWLFTKSGKLIGMYDLPRKLPKGANLKSLSKILHERLLELVPTVVAKCRIKQPAYCLILGYDGEGNGVMPPMVSIGLDSERKAWIEKDKRNARERIWSPDEFQHRLAKPRDLPTDKKLEKACEWFNRILEDKESDRQGRDLLNRVAKDLAALKWEDRLPITDDFVVFAVDYEGADLRENMRKSVPAGVQTMLKKRGLI